MIRNRSVLIPLILVGSMCMAAQAQRGFGFPGFGHGKVVTGEPYTASLTETSLQTLANGTTISHGSTITEARDSEGRTYRSVTNTPEGSSSQAITRTTVFDPVAHTITEWSTQSTTAIVTALPQGPRPGAGPGGWSGPPAGRGPGQGHRQVQVTRTTLTPTQIAGVEADGIRTTTTVPAGVEGNSQPLVSVREVWTSPELKIVLQETSQDPREGSRQLQTTSLTPGTPNPELFQLPQGYTVKTQTRHRGF